MLPRLKRIKKFTWNCSGTSLDESRCFFGSLGGRKNPLGGHIQREKGVAKVKQGPVLGTPRRIPGTTKITYTNLKGRTFNFTIPVSQITHPQVLRQSPAPDGWRDIKTSFCDTGDLEDDMVSPVDECLEQHVFCEESTGERHVGMDQVGLRELQRVFVSFCRDYVLMDTRGMKTSMTYSELNSGPDYEMYDRKVMRKRYWLTIRRVYDNVKELLWPSTLLTQDECDMSLPLLSCEEMLDALLWLEAASTFCVRKSHSYDVAAVEEFLPLKLQREVRVLARCVRECHSGGFFLAATPSAEGGESNAARQNVADRFLSCVALAANHGVAFQDFFACSALISSPHSASGQARSTVRITLTTLPPLQKTWDAIRIMHVLQMMAGDDNKTCYCFSSTTVQGGEEAGKVEDAALLAGLSQVCDRSLFNTEDSLGNVNEAELRVMLEFAVAVREQNPSFFASKPRDAMMQRQQDALLHFTQLTLARCRYLVYQLGGPQASVMSGDEEYIPLLDLQRHAEKSHPLAHVHYKIGMRDARGLRFARLHTSASSTLVELLCRLDAVGSATGLRLLTTDLVHHIAHKVAMSREGLTLPDVLRVLPLLATMMETATGDEARTRLNRLISAFNTTIGVELQHERQPWEVVALLEGLAACRLVPSCFKQMEMVLLRMIMQQQLTLAEMTRSLLALAKLVGCRSLSSAVLQAVATAVAQAIEASLATEQVGDALQLLHALYYCHYHAFSTLMMHLSETNMFVHQRLNWPPSFRCSASLLTAFAGVSLSGDEERSKGVCETALRELLTSLEAKESDTPWSDDLLVATVTVCASLGLSHPPDALCTWVRHARQLHTFCTPQLALSVLESLEALGLESTPMYTQHLYYVGGVLKQLDASFSAEPACDHAEVAVRVLYLRKGSPEVAQQAVIALEKMMEGLLHALDTTESGVCTGAISFEQRFLRQMEADGLLREKIMHYSAALEHHKSALA